MIGNATRILIVEDDPDIAELVARYLDKAGFTDRARRVGTRRARRRSPRSRRICVVLDLMLPQVDGLEVCRVVRGERRPRPRSRSSC